MLQKRKKKTREKVSKTDSNVKNLKSFGKFMIILTHVSLANKTADCKKLQDDFNDLNKELFYKV